MAEKIRIKKGFDIPLAGMPSSIVTDDRLTSLFAISPDDFPGPVWKAVVKPEETVNAGDPLLVDKATGKVRLVSPVAGRVKEVHRGERRHIEYVSVSKEGDPQPVNFGNNMKGNEAKEAILASGLWAMMRQRPFDIVPDPEVAPRDIFVTAFDSAPLAGELLSDSLAKWLEAGLETLASLTAGKVYLGIKAGSNISSKAAEVYEFEGPHPAGNVGTQIAAIKPVNKGETVWTLDAVTAAKIGKLVKTGEADLTTTVALTGPDVKDPHLISTFVGASIDSLIKDALVKEEGVR
ncbi:MAG: NADH:ubiquinone reductase (Na(+)-transporting) subunit A, partial [Muribaculaceae bacterium]|nr:NADH:ubiquinone reductase (Na(+)-transporting) subunit A [Muribaculaceae bacterium]